MDAAIPPDTRTVRTVGRYALYDEIAAGGMATVHLGRLMGPVGFSRTVAIKRLHPQYAKDPHFVAMFLDEARLAARIRHPNVVSTLDVVATDGELFLVMEYIHGESLSGLIKAARHREGRMPPAVVCSIMTGMLNGLHAAHQARSERGELLGIVHRDVSPQNVLVGVDGVPRVLDFGVAKAVGRLQTTNDGQLKGKFSYMAPEQIEGGQVGPYTDVFAAGLVMWEALVGRRPIQGGTEVERMYKIVRGEIPRMRSVVPSLSEALDEVVMRALAKDVSQRYATALEMAVAIEGLELVVAQRRIGAYAEDLVGERLAVRAKRAEEIETVSDASVPRPGTLQAGGNVDVLSEVGRASDEEDARQRISMVEPAEIPPPSRNIAVSAADLTSSPELRAPQSSGTFGAASAPALVDETTSAEPPRRRPALIVVGVVLGGAALLAAVALGRTTAPARSDRATLAPPPSASAAAPNPATSAPAEAVAPAAASTAPGTAMASASAAPSASPAPSAAASTPAPVAKSAPGAKPPARTGAAKANCAVPFTVDERGIRRLKPECN